MGALMFLAWRSTLVPRSLSYHRQVTKVTRAPVTGTIPTSTNSSSKVLPSLSLERPRSSHPPRSAASRSICVIAPDPRHSNSRHLRTEPSRQT